MVLRLLQFQLLDHLMIQLVALKLVVHELKVLLSLAPSSLVLVQPLRQSLVLVLLPRQSQALVLQFQ